MRGLKLRQPPGFGIVGLFDQVPDPPFRVAETGKGAQAFRVGQVQGWPFDGLRLFQVRLAAGGLGPVKFGLGVAAIAERLVAGVAAAAQRILRLRRMFLAFAVIEGIALGIGGNPLLAERQPAGDEIGTILGDFNFRPFTLFHNRFVVACLRST